MPIVDMSLEKLKVYQGINPRPADFDEFWDRSLAEMNALDPKPEWVPHPFKSRMADCFDLYFTGTKGAKIHANVAIPKDRTGKVPAVLHFHGLSGACDSFRSLMSYVSQGYVIASMDSRGQGGQSQDVGGVPGTTYTTPFTRGLDGDPSDLLVRDMFLDTALLAKIIMNRPEVDETRVGCFGGSQGGGLSVACAALVPSIKICVATYPYMSDYKRVWNMDLAKGAYEGIRYFFRYYDPRHEREDEIFTKLGYIDIQFLAPRIRAEVMMCTGLMDTTCPPSTQFAAYNKITSQKSVLIYPDFGHETLYGNDDAIFDKFAEL